MIDLNRVNYATGSKEILHDVSFSINTGDKVGLVGSNGAGNKIKDDRIKKILKNPFYYGYFMYNDELHKGEHTTIISKSLCDKCQRVMERRGRAHRK